MYMVTMSFDGVDEVPDKSLLEHMQSRASYGASGEYEKPTRAMAHSHHNFILRVSCFVVFNLHGCVSLEELYLSHRYYENGRLEDLWHNDNSIASLKGLAEAIAGATEKLTTIYLE
ncbi:hypothetical protein T459_21520 [Capsicum annuum]|uniref:Uncharacterized protein n=1 Tax=Capsicum annuum TaxID=4072 RepID=A0A2G2YX07_CAPAN|nr:hypothetical protein T459_21520 [Capsicum annuum]